MKYINLKVPKDKYEFRNRMSALEKYYGFTRTQRGRTPMQTKQPKTVLSPKNSSYSPDSRRLSRSSTGIKMRDFIVSRDNIDYTVEVFDETKLKGRYVINVMSKSNPKISDTLSLTQAHMPIEDMVQYLEQNLRIYTKADGRIDYLSIKHDATIRNSSQDYAMRAGRSLQGTPSVRNMSLDGESRTSNSMRQSLDGSRGPAKVGLAGRLIDHKLKQAMNSSAQQVTRAPRPPTATAKPTPAVVEQNIDYEIQQFSIERNNETYMVTVKEREGQGHRLQITVTAVADRGDSKYMIYPNKNMMQKEQLVKYCKSHIIVYQKVDQAKNKNVIDYISMSQDAEVYSRSSTMTLGEDRSKVATKKNLIKGRANKRVSHTQQDSVNMSHRSINSTVRTSVNLDTVENQQIGWEELAKQKVTIDGNYHDAVLYAKTQSNTDNEHYKICIVHLRSNQTIGQLDLSPQACYRVLKIEATDMDRENLQEMSLQQLMRGEPKLDNMTIQSQKKSSSFLQNRKEWNQILANMTYDSRSQQVKFDVWNLCGSKQNLDNIPVQLSVNKPMTVGVKSKFDSPTKTRSREISSRDAVEEQKFSLSSRIDGGQEGNMSDYIQEDIPQPNIQIQRRKPQQAILLSPTSSIHHEVDIDEEPEQTGPSIVRSKAGSYYRMQVFRQGENFHLTLFDNGAKSAVCVKQAIPQSFTSAVDDDGMERLYAVKRAIEAKIKSASSVKNASGELDISIFTA